MKRKKGLLCVLATVVLLGLTGCGSKQEDNKITVYLHNPNLLQYYAPTLQEMVPEAELEFVVGRDTVDFFVFKQENGDLPDIITVGNLSARDAIKINDYLLDISQTDTAASFYETYLENYTNSDGSVKWLPAGGEACGTLANLALFEQYDIELPVDYPSFVSACRAFEEHGIRPYVSDYKYDYTCLYNLEGVAISTLMKRGAVNWRRDYEDGITDSLDENIWMDVFEKMEAFIEDTGLTEEDISRGYSMTYGDFMGGNVAMIRAMSSYLPSYAENFECAFLPYFGDTSEDSWLLVCPRFHVALNGALNNEENAHKKELALKVLDAMFSAKSYEALTSGENSYLIPYNRGVGSEIPESLKGIENQIDTNHLYILLSSDRLLSSAKDTIPKMLTGELDAKEAYRYMNQKLTEYKDAEADREIVATLEKAYSVSFQKDKGSEASSSIANTFRKIGNSDILLAPSSICTGSMYATGYTAELLDGAVQSSGNRLFTCQLTGAEIREIIRLAVEGCGTLNDPISDQTLPIVSGCTIKVKKEQGSYLLTDILVDGSSLADDAEFTFTIADHSNRFTAWVNQALGEGANERFSMSEDYAHQLWTDYIAAGNQPEEPASYIILD